MRKALALLAICSLSVVPSFAGPPSFKQATSDYQAGKYQVALIEFEKFRESYPTNLQVRYYEALCYQGLNQLDKAREEFQFVIDNDEGRLKASAQAGLKQLDDSHSAANGYSQHQDRSKHGKTH
jgi:tetratricopeptide (TPR) repeat protein